MPNRTIDVDGKTYAVTFERQIARSLRTVVASAIDENGGPVAIQAVNTSSAKGYLDRDTDAVPATWEDLETIAVDLLRVELEQ